MNRTHEKEVHQQEAAGGRDDGVAQPRRETEDGDDPQINENIIPRVSRVQRDQQASQRSGCKDRHPKREQDAATVHVLPSHVAVSNVPARPLATVTPRRSS